MRRGQLCRKCTSEGVAYGSLMIVDKPTWNNVTCHYIDDDEGTNPITLRKNCVKVLEEIKLCVSRYDFMNILENYPQYYYHEPSEKWLNAANGDIDLLILRCQGNPIRMYIKDCAIEKVIQCKKGVPKQMVRVTVGDIVLCK